MQICTKAVNTRQLVELPIANVAISDLLNIFIILSTSPFVQFNNQIPSVQKSTHLKVN